LAFYFGSALAVLSVAMGFDGHHDAIEAMKKAAIH
jgi:uncharacterized membrane protein